MKKLILTLTVVAVSAMASAKTYTVQFFQPTLINGTELKAGEYKVDVQDSKAVIKNGKQSIEADVKVETAGEKFSSTSVRYRNGDGKYRIQEIRLGGTTTRLVFN